MVREMLIKSGESFTAEKVVSMALKQNIGLDPSYSTFEKDFGENDSVSKLKRIGRIFLHRRPTNQKVEHSHQYFSMNTFPNDNKLREIISTFELIYILRKKR